jgi:hypothetical protein
VPLVWTACHDDAHLEDAIDVPGLYMYWSDFKALAGQRMFRGRGLRDGSGIWNDLELFRIACRVDRRSDGRIAFPQFTSRDDPTLITALMELSTYMS